MNTIKFIFPILSFLILSAHSLRVGNLSFFVIYLILLSMLFLRYGWIRYILITALAWGSFIWIKTSFLLIQTRLNFRMPWTRLSVIMFITLLIILFSIYLLSKNKFKERYNLNTEKTGPLSIIFIISFVLLELMRNAVPIKLIIIERFFPGLGGIEIFLLSLYGVWIGNKMLNPEQTPKIRARIWAFFSFIFFLQLLLGLAGIDQMLMTGKLHLPVPALIIAGPLYRGSNFFMPILFLSTILLVGPAWCSHLCYIGAWDDGMSRLSRSKIKSLPAWTKIARNIILTITIFIPVALSIFNIGAFTGLIIASVFGLTGILIMVTISRKLGLMVHCSVFCPIGLAGNILGKISPWRIKINSGCNRCMKCTQACKYNALNKEDLENNRPGLSCTLCGDCLIKCNDSHITYHFPKLTSETARTSFIVLIVIIHVVFLSVARM